MPRGTEGHRDGEAQPEESSEFTQLFGSNQASRVDESALPFAPAAGAFGSAVDRQAGDAFTKAFAAPDNGSANESTLNRPAQPPQAPTAEAPTQIFAAVPPSPSIKAGVSATDETRIFNQPPQAQVVAADQGSSSLAPGAVPHAPSEFTSVFQRIAPPPTMPKPAAETPLPNAGEFTQFFSAVAHGERGPESMPRAAVPKPAVFQAAAPAQELQREAPLAPAQGAQSGEFTQLFRQQVAPEPPTSAQSAAQAPREQAQPDGFTQMFSQLQPSAAHQAAPSTAPLSPAPASTPAPAPSPFGDPIFGAPPPRGTFTDAFTAQGAPSQRPTGPGYVQTSDPFAPRNGSGFGLDRPAPPVSPAFGAPAPLPTAPIAAAAGDFTRLMQSLETPASAQAAPAVALPVDPSFFAAGPAASSAESEYTRVLRGGAGVSSADRRSAAAAAGSGAAPGLALAPAVKQDAKNDEPVKGKPKTLVILLVAVNVVLLLALVVIGLVLLRHR